MNPYAEIRKVPLDYQGVQSSAYSVQTYDVNKKKETLEWNEVGTVSSNYLLIDNAKVRDMATHIANESGLHFETDKVYYDGRRYVHSLIAKDTELGEVAVGDNIALGFQMWNSYDGSTSLGFRMMLYRLVCLNGMTSKINLSRYRFRHNPTSENWEEEIENVAHSLKSASRGDNNSVHTMINRFKSLNESTINMNELERIRKEYINDIPTQLWGSVMDRFFDKEGYSGWDFLNASTDELWHKDKPTIASFNHNATIVDGLCNWIAA